MTFSRELGRNRKILSNGREKEGVEKAVLEKGVEKDTVLAFSEC